MLRYIMPTKPSCPSSTSCSSISKPGCATSIMANDQDRKKLVHQLVQATQAFLDAHGTTQRLANASRSAYRAATLGYLEILMTTPFTRVSTGKGDYQYTITIRDRSENADKKSPTLFDVGWDPAERWADNFKVFKLKKGEWINILLLAAKVEPK